MRLWTIHPKYLDAKGLVALWREGLLAQKVLRGATKGYRHHPQLRRFKEQSNPVAAMATFLESVHAEAERRGYRFNRSKISRLPSTAKIRETRGQLLHEWEHLKKKLCRRDPKRFAAHRNIIKPQAHPLFQIVYGDSWERPNQHQPATLDG